MVETEIGFSVRDMQYIALCDYHIIFTSQVLRSFPRCSLRNPYLAFQHPPIWAHPRRHPLVEDRRV